MSPIDQLGTFYLGRRHDLATGATDSETLLYASKDLTTHAVCVGMTGSGKTGLCLALLEEAALRGIPAIAIDPKGDLGNLLLAFPRLAPADFRPWIDESEAARKQMSPDDFAAGQAELWRTGLAKWNQGPERIQRFVDAVDRVIYTPGSNAGIPITVLKSFHAPPPALVADDDALRELIASAASGLLALLGIDADPVRSREHIFLSNVLEAAWRAGQDLDLPQLMRQIQQPPFRQIGVVDLESFYPAAERTKLALSLNNLLASPSFASWLQGEPLDVARLLYAPDGRPRLAIVSIAHLDDAQRMFFVTILLNEVLAWIRTQPGTSSLRAILYMDEIFGYFPPVANPPSKRPMLTLLKQARAYGLGCVLATQNPVDLDYKGLSNAGTWLLGRLQTERDKSRVIEGLEGASAQAGASFNRRDMEARLAALGSRVFLMNNVHEDQPIVFHSRWAMSYLCGPLTRTQIKTLMDPRRGEFAAAAGNGVSTDGESDTSAAAAPASASRPILPATIREEFAAVIERIPDGYRLEYRPGLLGVARLRYALKGGSDVSRDCCRLRPIHGASPDNVWDGALEFAEPPLTEPEPEEFGQFAELPSELAREKSYPVFTRQLADHLSRTVKLPLWRCTVLDVQSAPDETEADFRTRLRPLAAERLAAERKEVEDRFAGRLASAEAKIDKAKVKLSTHRWTFFARLGSILWVIVEAIMRRMGQGRRGRPRSMASAVNQAGTGRRQHATAQIDLDQAKQSHERLQNELAVKLAELDAQLDPDQLIIEPLEISPRKGDVDVDRVTLVWLPWRIDPQDTAEPIY